MRFKKRAFSAVRNLGWLLLITLGWEVSAAASATDVQEVADTCMYANRVLKDYALVGMGVTYHDPGKDLKKGVGTVDKYLADVLSHDINDGLMTRVKDLETSWKSIQASFMAAPDTAKAAELREAIDAFTKKCEELAFDLAKDTSIEGEEYVVMVSELGMEVQHLGALYMLQAWQVPNDHYAADVDKAVAHFKELYDKLQAANEKHVSAEIKSRLKAVDDQFLVFTFMAKSKTGRFMPTRAEKILTKVFDDVREILKLEKELVE